MRRLMLCALAVAAAGLLGWLPATQKDVGELLPAQTLVATVEDGVLTLDGGEDLSGSGADWASAMDDLRETAPGEAFFGATAQIILVGEAETALPDVLDDRDLRPAARVYAGRGEIEAESATKFLEAHKDGVTIQALQAAALEGREEKLAELVSKDGRYHLNAG